MKREMKGNLMLLSAAVIWGAAFVAQSEGMEHIGPFTMQATRFFLASVFTALIIAVRDKTGKSVGRPVTKADHKRLLFAGLLSGLFLFLASSLQQIGLIYTTVGKSGFVTALYIVIVPLLGLFAGQRPGGKVWLGVGIAVVGMYFLCLSEGLSVNVGDLLTLGCALFYSLQILFIDKYAGNLDGVRFSLIQYVVCSALAAVVMVFAEEPTWEAILACWLPIAYAGILSGGLGYMLQIMGQQLTKPAVASLLMSFESVFAALFGWLLIGQSLTGRELFGCGLMFTAIILAQLPGKKTA